MPFIIEILSIYTLFIIMRNAVISLISTLA